MLTSALNELEPSASSSSHFSLIKGKNSLFRKLNVFYRYTLNQNQIYVATFGAGLHYTVSPNSVQQFRRRNTWTSIYNKNKRMSELWRWSFFLLISWNTKHIRYDSMCKTIRSNIWRQWILFFIGNCQNQLLYMYTG